MSSYAKLVSDSYEHLFHQPCLYEITVKYSAHFKGYNARISLRGNLLTLRLSKQWRTVSKEIQMGLIEHLFTRLLKRPEKTTYIDLYHMFMKRVHIAVPKTKDDPILAKLFDELNKSYLSDLLEKPNLEWGSSATRRVGYYNFGTDTITMSTILHPDNVKLHNAKEDLLAYVLYHELLHKKFKYSEKKLRSHAHTKEFREWEERFPNAKVLDQELNLLAYRSKKAKAKPRPAWWPF